MISSDEFVSKYVRRIGSLHDSLDWYIIKSENYLIQSTLI